MIRTIYLSMVGVAFLCGCVSVPQANLYPVQGPLAAQKPPPIYPVSVSATPSVISATLGGTVVTGPWAAVAQQDTSAGQLSAQWDAVYGQGFFVANVLGNQHFNHATLSGPGGASLTAEFLFSVRLDPSTNVSTAAVKGVAVDNQGNVYKLTN